MIKTINSKSEIILSLKHYLLDRGVFKALGEPILYDEGDVFVLKEKEKYGVAGFAAYNISDKNVCRLKYMYVDPSFRKSGFFSELYKAVEDQAKLSGANKITATSTDLALGLYINKGFSILKSWKNYHNISKSI